MFTGKLEQIFISDETTKPMQSRAEAEAVAGQGLAGDRYSTGDGSFADPGNPDREVTLIEIEAIEAVVRDYDLELTAQETRRNLATSDVPLNHLVGREFFVGEAKLRGIKLCEPCGHLEGLTRKGILKALKHRGGLRAQILTSGTVRVGDTIRLA